MEQNLLKLLAAFTNTSVVAFVSTLQTHYAHVSIYSTPIDIAVFYEDYVVLHNGRTCYSATDVSEVVSYVMTNMCK